MDKKLSEQERREIFEKANIKLETSELTEIKVNIADLESRANDVPARIALLQVKVLSEIANILKEISEKIETDY